MTKMLQEIMEQPRVLAGIEEANKPTLEALTAELKERGIKHALFSARGTSDHASIYAQYMLCVYCGVTAALATPSCVTLYGADPDLSQELVIGVSQSGKAADALAVLEHAAGRGAVTVAVTNDPESPMAKAAKYHLFCNAGSEVSVAATKTFTAQLYVLGLLAAYWSGSEELLAALRKVPQHCEAFLSDLGQLEMPVARFRYVQEGFVLARGFAYPVALESALKTQETCYIKMKGHAISDFYHGPLAQLDMNTPVIVMAVKGAAFADAKEMLGKIKEIGTQALVVTDDAELAAQSEYCVRIPDTGYEATAPFLLALFAQNFAQALSVSRGLNPDEPRLLKKVTITK